MDTGFERIGSQQLVQFGVRLASQDGGFASIAVNFRLQGFRDGFDDTFLPDRVCATEKEIQ